MSKLHKPGILKKGSGSQLKVGIHKGDTVVATEGGAFGGVGRLNKGGKLQFKKR